MMLADMKAGLLQTAALLLIAGGPGDAQEGPIRPELLLCLDEGTHGFRTPMSVAVDEKTWELYVADREAGTVFVFAEDGRPKARLPIPGPVRIAVDRRGRLLVADTQGGLECYTFQGRREGPFPYSGLPEGTAAPKAGHVAVDADDNVFVADPANHAVLAFRADGSLIRAYGSLDGKGKRFAGPVSFALARNRVHVLDLRTYTLSAFSRHSGEFLFGYGERGGGIGQLASPAGLAVDKEGRVYVLDTLQCGLVIYNEEGGLLGVCGLKGKDPGRFYHPGHLVLDGKGRFYVTETLMRRVQVVTVPVGELERRREAERKEPGKERK